MKTRSLSKHIFAHSIWLLFILFLSILFILVILSSQVTESTISSLAKLDSKVLNQPNAKPISSLYKNWEDIPIQYQKLFNKSELKDHDILEAYFEEDTKVAYLYRYINEEDKVTFVLSVYLSEDIFQLTDDIFTQTISDITLSLFFIFILLFFIFKWLITRSSQPYRNLSSWVEKIQDSSGTSPKIDFTITEVNDIALQLQEKISTIQEYAKREEEFLKYTSHELRTPLAIIQASLDTVNEINQDEKIKRPLHRALRASANIQLISSALLYLARESKQAIKKSEVNIEDFINKIINDHLYLIAKKDLQVHLEILENNIQMEEELFFIIFSNLIRNAFQHSFKGHVYIQISKNNFSVSNTLDTQAEQNKREISFSLGLKLVELISQKLSYSFETHYTETLFIAKLGW